MATQTKTPNESADRQSGTLMSALGLSCMAAALLSGVLKGLWELSHPILVDALAFASASSTRLLAYGALEVIKSAGFLAGLFGFYLFATKRGTVLKIFMTLALLGGIFFAAVWLIMAVTARHTLVYVLGGMWYQIIAPVALGVAALFGRRISWWQSVWAILVGVVNSQIFRVLGPGKALLVQGVIWLVFGYIVYSFSRRS
jgi:hypothetical protein